MIQTYTQFTVSLIVTVEATFSRENGASPLGNRFIVAVTNLIENVATITVSQWSTLPSRIVQNPIGGSTSKGLYNIVKHIP